MIGYSPFKYPPLFFIYIFNQKPTMENQILTQENTEIPLKTPSIKFKRNHLPDLITKKIVEIVEKNTINAKFSSILKKELDKCFGLGWNVFSGLHFSGSCSFQEGCFCEFEIDENIVVVFKTISGKVNKS